MGNKDSAKNILNYAKEIFGEGFEEDVVITEDRLSAYEFFDDYEITDFTLPTNDDIEKLKAYVADDNQESYLDVAVKAWICCWAAVWINCLKSIFRDILILKFTKKLDNEINFKKIENCFN
jgi:hypothetical protein